MTNPSHNFWQFSLHLYQAPEVAKACLELQNSHGLDVNMLLFCCWHGTALGALPTDLLKRAYTLSSNWRGNVVQPLRNARTWMKTESPEEFTAQAKFEALRAQIKAVELSAEQMQQYALESMALESTQDAEPLEAESAIRENLKYLLELADTQPSPALDQMLAVLVYGSLAATESLK